MRPLCKWFTTKVCTFVHWHAHACIVMIFTVHRNLLRFIRGAGRGGRYVCVCVWGGGVGTYTESLA